MLRNCRMVVLRARCRVNAQGFATAPGTRTIGIVRRAFYWRTAYWKDALPGEEAGSRCPGLIQQFARETIWENSPCF